jgi:hypothetical protein
MQVVVKGVANYHLVFENLWLVVIDKITLGGHIFEARWVRALHHQRHYAAIVRVRVKLYFFEQEAPREMQ